MLYFNNQLIVYTFSELSEDDAVKLADLVEGEIVGHLSGSINALQIRVKTSTLDELKSMATQLMKHTDVLYAGYDYPMQLSQSRLILIHGVQIVTILSKAEVRKAIRKETIGGQKLLEPTLRGITATSVGR